MRKITDNSILIAVLLVGSAVAAYVSAATFTSVSYDAGKNPVVDVAPEPPKPVVTHVAPPDAVKGIYVTSWVAGTKDWRERLIAMVEETELNTVIVDIKDYSGTVSFIGSDPLLEKTGAYEKRIADPREFINSLHEKDIYVVGRITVFQDPLYARQFPDQAVQRESDKSVWEDHKGLSFVDVGARPFWDYIIALSKESYALGFDELNYDYVRFPSDGNMDDIYYPLSEARIIGDPQTGKAEAVRDFFEYLHDNMKDTGAYMSADLFGMTTTNPDDLNIGQILEYAEPYFDYIAPMVYPSHYPPGFLGYGNPNEYPYEVILHSMSKAADRMVAASSTPEKLRPWLQDFDYGGDYGPAEVRAQIQATYDAGLDSWMLWDPANRYTPDALLPATTSPLTR